MYVENYPDRYKSPREREIERRQTVGVPMNMAYGEIQEYLDPFYRTYTCADGRPFYVVCASHKHHVTNALKLMGLWEEMQAKGLPDFDAYLPTDQWPEGQDCTFAAYPFSPVWAKTISTVLTQVFKIRSAFAWEQVWGEAGIPAVAHRTTQEWLRSEHALASGLVLEIEDSELGRTRQMGNLVWLAQSSEKALDKTCAPLADADHEEILNSYFACWMPTAVRCRDRVAAIPVTMTWCIGPTFCMASTPVFPRWRLCRHCARKTCRSKAKVYRT
jgi:crotonobetainyl-CoA:carnitine CoA-transferase CaiB-like acyl-CoA transferase